MWPELVYTGPPGRQGSLRVATYLPTEHNGDRRAIYGSMHGGRAWLARARGWVGSYVLHVRVRSRNFCTV